MQPKLGEKNEEMIHHYENHIIFIPNWCLKASNDDFLCGEDVCIHSSLIIEEERSIDEIKYSTTVGKPSIAINTIEDESSNTHCSSYMQFDYETFKFIDEGYEEKVLGEEVINHPTLDSFHFEDKIMQDSSHSDQSLESSCGVYNNGEEFEKVDE